MRGAIQNSAGVLLVSATGWLLVVSVEHIGGKRVIETSLYRKHLSLSPETLSLLYSIGGWVVTSERVI
jgi:hypothetical protein